VRFLAVTVTLAASIILALIALQLPPFVPAGANLSEPAQADYAANIWPESQVSLLMLALFLPWLIYAVIQRGSLAGRIVVFALGLAGVSVSTWAVTVSLESYMARPQAVSGFVVGIDGRNVTLDCGVRSTYHLAISDRQFEFAQSWLRRGAPVLLYVSPRGQAGYLGLDDRGPSCSG
jgi:hypothetical protein